MSVLEHCNPTSSQINTMTLFILTNSSGVRSRVATISNVNLILFDTGVVIITILSSIQTLRLWWKGDIWDKKSLISLVIYQGKVLSHGFVLTITLASTITSKVLRLLYGIKQRISTILAYLNNSFQAARRSIHTAIVAEFGNPFLSHALGTETMEDNIADQEGQQSPEEPGIWKNGRGLIAWKLVVIEDVAISSLWPAHTIKNP
ncbi:hypothetical protein JB92DRAFT_2828091 [Gautieria morchelliformis]|nr:hypothetical protein JB92DRAFT_2828091 [Gautieria morchelliformis]